MNQLNSISQSENALILVWSNVGQKLKKIDDNRLLAIAQKNADYHLTTISLKEILPFIKDLDEKFNVENPPSLDDLKKLLDINEKDNLFREISKFFNESHDNLSIGSALTEPFDKSKRMMDLLEDR